MHYTLSIIINQILNGRLNFKQIRALLPLTQPCLLCKNFEGGELGLCEDCLHELPWHTSPHCPQCALESTGEICGQCLTSAPHFDRTLALFTYDFPADALLQHFKYQQAHHLAHTFGHLFTHHLSHCQAAKNIDVIFPMPMHPIRLKERGFNQALEIARILAKNCQIPLDFESGYRKKYTPPQATLPLKDRVKNMQDVFACDNYLQNLNIAIVDDVMTSGASLNALAKTLKEAGAQTVECWVVARTLPH